jgi:hypothetical protein
MALIVAFLVLGLIAVFATGPKFFMKRADDWHRCWLMLKRKKVGDYDEDLPPWMQV